MMVNVRTNCAPRALTDTISAAGAQTKALMKRSRVALALRTPVVEAGGEEFG